MDRRTDESTDKGQFIGPTSEFSGSNKIIAGMILDNKHPYECLLEFWIY